MPDPVVLFKHNRLSSDTPIPEKKFTIKLLGKDGIAADQASTNVRKMIDLVQKSISKVVKVPDQLEFYTENDPRIERYFNALGPLKKDTELKSQTIAILDDKKQRGGNDLIFTTYGIIPVSNNAVKQVVAYKAVEWDHDKKQNLIIDGRYENPAVDYGELYSLIQSLSMLAKEPPVTQRPKLFGIF